MTRRLPGVAWLAIISSAMCLAAIAAVVMMLGLLGPDDLAQLGRLAR